MSDDEPRIEKPMDVDEILKVDERHKEGLVTAELNMSSEGDVTFSSTEREGRVKLNRQKIQMIKLHIRLMLLPKFRCVFHRVTV